jgi:hypothetical protein
MAETTPRGISPQLWRVMRDSELTVSSIFVGSRRGGVAVERSELTKLQAAGGGCLSYSFQIVIPSAARNLLFQASGKKVGSLSLRSSE